MRRVLFVDDEPMVLKSLETLLRPQRRRWEMVFVTSAAAAVKSLQQQPFDVVVSDMRMPGVDGAELLERVAREWPRAGRIVLTGYADEPSIERVSRVAHLRLDKPCASDALCGAIEDAMPDEGRPLGVATQ